MKRIFFVFFGIFIFALCSAREYFVSENYDSCVFEIIENGNIIYELPFSRFCGYQIANDKIFFIDCSKSRIYEYGEICFFDCNLKNIQYTGILSGSSFYITADSKYLLASTLLESSEKYNIEDIFGFEIKAYPLNISVYDFKNFSKIRVYSFEEKLDQKELKNLYVEFIPISNDEIQIRYGIYDSTYKIDCGILQLREKEIFVLD